MKKEPIGYIYMFTNRINGKKYIGQHEYENGIDENYFGSGYIFASAKEKYDIENFKFDILCWCDSKEELDNAESYYIGFKYYTYANTGRGYNIADGGNGGSKFRGKTEEEMEEIGKKMSEARKGEKNPMYGKNPYANKSEEEKEEFRKRMSEANKGKTLSEDVKKKLSDAHKGKTLSEEHKKKLSEAKKGKYTGENHPMARKVRCIETGEIFSTLKEGTRWCGLKSHVSITLCCQGKSKSAGKHPITGEKLHWTYVDEETIETINLNLLTISNIKLNI